MSRIFVLSDNDNLNKNIKSDLADSGFLLKFTTDRKLDLEEVLRFAPDVILFDLPSWNEEKEELYKLLTTDKALQHLELVFIFLVNENSLNSLKSQPKFDDFLLVPYKPGELSFRLKYRLNEKNKLSPKDCIHIRELTIKTDSYEVLFRKIPLELTYKEYELLKHLASNPGRAFTREALLNIVWGYDYFGGTRTVDVHVRRIRAKLGDNEDYIKTIHGVGYLFKD